MVNDEYAPGKYLDDAAKHQGFVFSLADMRIGQAVDRSAVTDFVRRTDQVRFTRRQVNAPVSYNDPTDTEKVGSSGVQSRRLDIEADELTVVERGATFGKRGGQKFCERRFGVLAPQPSTTECEAQHPHWI